MGTNAAKNKACRVQTHQVVRKDVGVKIRKAKQTLLRRPADRSLLLSEHHSAAIAAPEFCADFMQCHDVLTELEVIR